MDDDRSRHSGWYSWPAVIGFCVLMFAIYPLARMDIARAAPDAAERVRYGVDPQVLRDIARQMRARYEYRTDLDQFGVVDYHQHPDDFHTRGGGDCEDWSFWAAREINRRLEIPTKVHGVWYDGETDGHAVVYLPEQDIWFDPLTGTIYRTQPRDRSRVLEPPQRSKAVTTNGGK